MISTTANNVIFLEKYSGDTQCKITVYAEQSAPNLALGTWYTMTLAAVMFERPGRPGAQPVAAP